MSIADKFRLLCPKAVTREIGDQTFKFYQCSPKTLARTARLVAHLAGSVSLLFADQAADSGHTVQDFKDPDGTNGQITQINAVTPDLVEARAERRRSAIESVVEGLLHDEHRLQLLGLIVNSMRDDFDRRDRQEQEQGVQLLDDMDIGPFCQFFVGMMQANASVFGDLGKQVVDRVQQTVGAAVDGAQPEPKETDG